MATSSKLRMKLFFNLSLHICIIFGVGFILSCRHRTRTGDILGNAAKVSVQLRDIDKKDREHPNFIYEAKGCVDEPARGTVVEEAGKDYVTVDFSITAVQIGIKCEIEVRLPAEDAYDQPLRFSERPLVMYFAKDIAVRLDTFGNFIATANMKRNYFLDLPESEQQKFYLTAKLKFPETQSQGQTLTGQIFCDPGFQTFDTKLTMSSGNEGNLRVTAMYKEGEKHSCRQVKVYADGKDRYFATMTQAKSIEPTLDGEFSLSDQTIELSVITPPPILEEGVTVTTETLDCDITKNKVFDTVRRECVDRPQ